MPLCVKGAPGKQSVDRKEQDSPVFYITMSRLSHLTGSPCLLPKERTPRRTLCPVPGELLSLIATDTKTTLGAKSPVSDYQILCPEPKTTWILFPYQPGSGCDPGSQSWAVRCVELPTELSYLLPPDAHYSASGTVS